MLAALTRIVQAVSQAATPELALTIATRQTRAEMGCACCSIYLTDSSRQSLILKATDGLNPSAVDNVCLALGEGLTGLVASREEPLNISHAHQHPAFKQMDEVHEEQLKAFLGTPLIHQRQLLGVLVVQHTQTRSFSDTEESFLITLAVQLASTLAHACASDQLSALGGGQSGIGRSITGSAAVQDKSTGGTGAMRQLALRVAAPGLAIGKGVWIAPRCSFDQVLDEPCLPAEIPAQIRAFDQAVAATRSGLRHLGNGLQHALPADVLAVFDMYQHLLDGASLGDAVRTEIGAGWMAPVALKRVTLDYVSQFAAMDDPYLRERATDVQDLGLRVLTHLLAPGGEPSAVTGQAEPDRYPPQTILIAEELTVTMLAEVPRHALCGLISLRGASNSHAVIIARALGIPALVGSKGFRPHSLHGRTLVINGHQGLALIEPGEAVLNEFRALMARDLDFQHRVEDLAGLEAVTPDGYRFELKLNAGLLADSSQSAGAAGIGLYRTEIPFMVREQFPSEQEQYRIYRRVLEQADGQPVVMRTLDIGGDKPLVYFPVEDDNPFLGWRGVRLTLDQPEIFLVQLRAMLRASIGLDNLRILLPMVSAISEVDACLKLIDQAWQEVCAEPEPAVSRRRPPVGVMLEVPALLWQLDALATRVDFCSVGTNDLVQYLLAVDRNNSRVAPLYDSCHPSVLRALKMVASECRRLGLPVSVCGEMAGEPAGAVLLMAMGYRDLSMSRVSLPRIKWLLRRFPISRARPLLERVIHLPHAADVRARVEQQLKACDAGELVTSR